MLVKTPSVLLAALLAGQAVAKTDIAGCVSSQTVKYGGASLIWYVPDTGEICEFLDCGGGRAPPKTTVPGCAAYEGTATYSPSFLPNFGASATGSSSDDSVPTAASTPFSAPYRPSSSSMLTLSAIVTVPAPGATDTVSSSATITPGPTATTLETSASVASNSENSESSTSTASSASGTSSVSQAAGSMPTAAVKGAVGVVVGLAAGVAML